MTRYGTFPIVTSFDNKRITASIGSTHDTRVRLYRMNKISTDNGNSKHAVLYRMVMPKHICPYGLKSKWLLEREGYHIEDHHLTSRAETEAFMEHHGVKTTPQT